MKYEIRKLSFGETLSQAFNLYFDNFGPLFLLALIGSIPAVLIPQPAVGPETAVPAEQQAVAFGAFLWVIVFIAINTISTALMIEFISKRYLKKVQTVSQYFHNVVPFLLPIIGLSIIEGILVGLGFLAFIIPGVYFALALSLSSQVLIVERKKVFESIRRSFNLTQGYKFIILGYLLALFMINLGVILIGDLFANIMSGMQLPSQAVQLFGHLLQVLLAPVGACLFILIYFNIRIEKEGFHLAHLAEQFALSGHLEPDGNRQDAPKE